MTTEAHGSELRTWILLALADAYGRALSVLEDVNTWDEFKSALTQLQDLKAAATETIGALQ